MDTKLLTELDKIIETNMTDGERYGVSDEKAVEIREWLEIRRLEGLKIDPETAEIDFRWTDGGDPYGVYETSQEDRGRSYFACAPGSEIWVSFDDLPDETVERIWERRRAENKNLGCSEFARPWANLKVKE